MSVIIIVLLYLFFVLSSIKNVSICVLRKLLKELGFWLKIILNIFLKLTI